jgi:hypothetical protein
MIIYLQYTDSKAQTWSRWHSTWDHERFIASQSAGYEKEGGQVAVITEQQYRAMNPGKQSI